jgi:type I restriction enzyme S subunit
MSENIELIRLGELCDSISGLWTGKKPPFEKAIVIRNTNFTKDCKLDLSNVAVLDVESKQLSKRRLLPGDLIVEKSGGGPKQAVGRVVYFDETNGSYSLSNFTSALRIKNPSSVLPKYIQHFLYLQYVSGVTESMQSNSTGIRNLNMHQFLDIKVPIPSIEKQREITEKLDQVFAEIDALEVNFGLIEKLIEEFDSSIIESNMSASSVDSERFRTVTLSEVSELISRGISPKYSESSNTIVVNQRCIRNGRIDLSFSRFHDEKIKSIQASKILNFGDGLINSTGVGTLGRTALFNSSREETFTVDSHVTIVRPNKKFLDHNYFGLILRSLEKNFVSLSTGTSGQTELPRQAIGATIISFPVSIVEQKNFFDYYESLVTATGELRIKLSEMRKLAESLRLSIFSSAFINKERI